MRNNEKETNALSKSKKDQFKKNKKKSKNNKKSSREQKKQIRRNPSRKSNTNNACKQRQDNDRYI